jgi:hypothetical protein
LIFKLSEAVLRISEDALIENPSNIKVKQGCFIATAAFSTPMARERVNAEPIRQSPGKYLVGY